MSSEDTAFGKCRNEKCPNLLTQIGPFCGFDCGLNFARQMVKTMVKEMPIQRKIRTKKSIISYSELKKIVHLRNMRKLRIRDLEAKQKFIDDCIEFAESKRFGDPSMKRFCGFDSRILTIKLEEFKYYCEESKKVENIVEKIDIQNNSISDVNVNQDRADEEMGMIQASAISTEEKDDAKSQIYICSTNGKCGRHDGWEFIKSQEVQMELLDEIKWYGIDQKVELELAFQCKVGVFAPLKSSEQ